MPAWERAETFAAYLELKKIDGPAWLAAQPAAYAAAAAHFATVGPRSFDQQKKFQLMDWRLAWPVISVEERRRKE